MAIIFSDRQLHDKKTMELVGSWAWDVITIQKKEPVGMKKLDIDFGCGCE